MSDRNRKLEEELQLRLLEIREDPTYQGSHDKLNKDVLVMSVDLAAEQPSGPAPRGTHTKH